MKITIEDILTTLEKKLTSSVSRSLNLSLGRAAAVGGFILSVHGLIAPISSPVAIYFAIFMPCIVFIVLGLSDYLKSTYLQNKETQCRLDQALVENAIAQPDLRTHAHIQSVLCHQKMGMTPTLIKYGTGGLDVSLSMISGASAIFINFMVPTVLKDKFGDERIRLASYVLATCFALYCGMASAAELRKSWKSLEDQHLAVRSALQRLSLVANDIELSHSIRGIDGAQARPGI